MRIFIHLSCNQQLIEVYKIVQLKWIMHQVVSTLLLAFLMLRWKRSSAMTGLSAIEVQFNLVAILIYIIVEKMLKKLLVFKSDKLQPQNFNCTSFSCNTNEKRELTHLRPLKYLQNILHFLLILVLIWRVAALIRMHCKREQCMKIMRHDMIDLSPWNNLYGRHISLAQPLFHRHSNALWCFLSHASACKFIVWKMVMFIGEFGNKCLHFYDVNHFAKLVSIIHAAY